MAGAGKVITGFGKGVKKALRPDPDEAARLKRAADQGFDTDRVLFHGTNQNIDSFDQELLGTSTFTESAKKGFFLTDNPDNAAEFAAAAGRTTRHNRKAIDKRIAEIQVEQERAIRRKDWDLRERLQEEWEEIELGADAMDPVLGQNIVPVYTRLKNPKIVDYDGMGPGEFAAKNKKGIADIIDEAQAAGNDGVIFKNIDDSAEGNISNHYFVFEPDQIRSVNAQFDPSKSGSSNILAGTAAAGVGASLLSEDAEAGTAGKAIKETVEKVFDRRFDPRVKEADRLKSLQTTIEPRQIEIPEIKLADLEGQGFVTSMSDRTRAGGRIIEINQVGLPEPINLRGGQDFMFDNPGLVWASGKHPTNQIMREAAKVKEATGVNPLFLPWRMAPTGGDFSSMTGETMLQFASANMTKKTKRKLDSQMKKLIRNWDGVDSPGSVQQFREAPDRIRKLAKQQLDVQFRNEGGLSLGEARLAVADPTQLNARDAGIQNVGRIDVSQDLVPSDHPAFPVGVPGEGAGRVNEDVGIFELLGDTGRNIPDPLNPSQQDIRSLQMKPFSGTITEDALKRLQARGVDVGKVDPRLLPFLGAAAAGGLLVEQSRSASAREKMQQARQDSTENIRSVIGGGEVAMDALSSLAGETLASFFTLASAFNPNFMLNQATRPSVVRRRMREAFDYEPKTDKGKQFSKAAQEFLGRQVEQSPITAAVAPSETTLKLLRDLAEGAAPVGEMIEALPDDVRAVLMSSIDAI